MSAITTPSPATQDPPVPARRPSRPVNLAPVATAPASPKEFELSSSPDPPNSAGGSHTSSSPATTASSPASAPAKSVAFSSPLRQSHVLPPSSPPPAPPARALSTSNLLPPKPFQPQQQQLLPTSPCFVHSLLDKGVSLAEWLRENSASSGSTTPSTTPPATASTAPSSTAPSSPRLEPTSHHHQHVHHPHTTTTSMPHAIPSHPGALLGITGTAMHSRLMKDSLSEALVDAESVGQPGEGGVGVTMDGGEDDELIGESLTKQLADTAVGVREMSKQLGRVRVRSKIQNVLIVTKARDNHLVKLTRKLALYLMLKKGENGRGLVVYVDSQLRHSRRFDAAGIERVHPELFHPVPRRRSSSATSLVSLSESVAAGMGRTGSMGNLSGENGAATPGGGEGQLRYWTSEMCTRSPHLFDFVVTLGGDGTVLFTSWLFQRIVPPVLPFALGSLGFLTNFDFAAHEKVMDTVIDTGIRVNLRMRFTCTVYRAVHPLDEDGEEVGTDGARGRTRGRQQRAVKRGATGEIMMQFAEREGWEALEGGYSMQHPLGSDKQPGHHHLNAGGMEKKDKEIPCLMTTPVETFEVLNDLVVDRGPSPYMSMLELFGDEHHLTTVQADGLILSTPTGSTAYSLSAGGSLVHPEIPALLISPICPHTLSFRPMLLPDSMELRICVPYNSRSTAWASFDGRGRVELKQGDHIKITASRYPFPTVCADKQSTDWFHAISRTLKWNERERQKSFVVVEQEPEKRNRIGKRSGPAKENGDSSRLMKQPPPVREEDEDGEEPTEEEDENGDEDGEEDEDDDKFDIDDSSGDTTTNTASSAVSPTVKPEPDPLSTYVSHMHLPDSQAHSKSGIETPGRYAGPVPHPPQVHPRHLPGPSTAASAPASVAVSGSEDSSSASGDTMRTPRPEDRSLVGAQQQHHAHHVPIASPSLHARSASAPLRRRDQSAGRRAFAVYGQDESDSGSGTSGSEEED